MTAATACDKVAGAPVAQLAELRPFKSDVVRSSRTGGTTFSPEQLPANMRDKIALELCPYPELPGFCWAWTHATTSRGYGSVAHQGKVWSTHKLAYTLLVGTVPDGLQIDHLCRNIVCCHPAHLEAVTAQVNNDRKPTRWRCDRGHPLAGPNLRIKQRSDRGQGRTQRECRYCASTWDVDFRARKRVYPAVERRRQAMLTESEAALRELMAATS